MENELILQALENVRKELTIIQMGYCDGETSFVKKKILCRNCPVRKECMNIKAQEIGLLMLLDNEDSDDGYWEIDNS